MGVEDLCSVTLGSYGAFIMNERNKVLSKMLKNDFKENDKIEIPIYRLCYIFGKYLQTPNPNIIKEITMLT